jgi:Fur family peroxide stress response transcriptional regulator
LNQKIKDLSRKLRENNIKPSYQRVKIFEYLIERKNHPTVDMIFTDLVKEIPTLSKATVYNTLDLFKESGFARILTIEGNETRYDCEITDHGHFKCESCGNIYDFPVDLENIPIDSLKHFKIIEKNIYFKGICPECQNKNKYKKEEKNGRRK